MKTILTLMLALLGLSSVVSAQDVRPNQTLQISITGVPVDEKGRLDNIYSVSSDGYITMWMIGSVKATGKSKRELASTIANKYKEAQIYTNPVFQIFSQEDVNAQDKQIVTVGGQVRRPGQQQWTKGLTLYAAIQSAGGETPYAAMKRVRLYREGKVYEYDMDKKASKAIEIVPFDTIEVPQTNIFNQ